MRSHHDIHGSRIVGAAGAIAAASLLLALACARTSITPGYAYERPLPRPDRVLVHEFATSPQDVSLDRGLGSRLWRSVDDVPMTSAQRELAQRVARTLATDLVERIRAMGLPASLAGEAADSAAERTLVITGQFLSIDQGNRARRIVIGLGAGHTDVRAEVEVYETLAGGRRRVDLFEVDAHSGRKPGLAETMGVGAAAGGTAIAAGAGVAGAAASEALGANVDADARRMAGRVASFLEQFFARQGWVEGDS